MAEIHLAFAGNIGVGKTEFTQQILKEPNRSLMTSFLKKGEGIKTFQEILDRRLLAEFYKDKQKWAFASQIYYFSKRLNTLKRIKDFDGLAVEDRTIFEDRQVFGQTNYEMGHMHELEFFVYDQTYKEICANFRPPTLLVYLKVRDVNVLKQRIMKRGRDEEKTISLEYLQKLNDNYDKLFDEYPFHKMAVNAETDMFEHPSYHTTVMCEIAQKLKKIGMMQKNDEMPDAQSMLLKGKDFTYGKGEKDSEKKLFKKIEPENWPDMDYL
ncbi:deoxynucleoside kinase [Candidatus Woesearchaeota archaeon]|nr:deoxynucleoside kinase [Candidatus Woesearchaeota archaeon]